MGAEIIRLCCAILALGLLLAPSLAAAWPLHGAAGPNSPIVAALQPGALAYGATWPADTIPAPSGSPTDYGYSEVPVVGWLVPNRSDVSAVTPLYIDAIHTHTDGDAQKGVSAVTCASQGGLYQNLTYAPVAALGGYSLWQINIDPALFAGLGNGAARIRCKITPYVGPTLILQDTAYGYNYAYNELIANIVTGPAATYWVDTVAGNDANNCTSQVLACKTDFNAIGKWGAAGHSADVGGLTINHLADPSGFVIGVGADFTCQIDNGSGSSGNILTVSAVTLGALANLNGTPIGMSLSASGLAGNTAIDQTQLSGTPNLAGTYHVNNAQLLSSRACTADSGFRYPAPNRSVVIQAAPGVAAANVVILDVARGGLHTEALQAVNLSIKPTTASINIGNWPASYNSGGPPRMTFGPGVVWTGAGPGVANQAMPQGNQWPGGYYIDGVAITNVAQGPLKATLVRNASQSSVGGDLWDWPVALIHVSTFNISQSYTAPGSMVANQATQHSGTNQLDNITDISTFIVGSEIGDNTTGPSTCFPSPHFPAHILAVNPGASSITLDFTTPVNGACNRVFSPSYTTHGDLDQNQNKNYGGVFSTSSPIVTTSLNVCANEIHPGFGAQSADLTDYVTITGVNPNGDCHSLTLSALPIANGSSGLYITPNNSLIEGMTANVSEWTQQLFNDFSGAILNKAIVHGAYSNNNPIDPGMNGSLSVQLGNWNRNLMLFDVNFGSPGANAGVVLFRGPAPIRPTGDFRGRYIHIVDTACPLNGSDKWMIGSGGTNFTGSQVGSVLTVSGYNSATDPPITAFSLVNGAGVAAGDQVLSFGSGTGGNGTYNMAISQTLGPIAMNASAFRFDGSANCGPGPIN